MTDGHSAEAATNAAAPSYTQYIQPALVHYNYGTALANDGQHEKALAELELALAYAKDDQVCTITYNIVLTREMQGDAKITGKDLSAAQTAYSQALSNLKQRPDGFKDTEIQARVQAKLDAVNDAMARNITKEDPNGNPASKDGTVSKDQEEQLKEAQKAAEKRRAQNQSFEREQEMDVSIEKPW